MSRPNIVFIMPDQLRADFLGCYGASFVDTPNIDALGEEGVTFERAYSEHPVCVPARASLISGMHALRTGVLDNGQFLRPDYAACGLRTWPETLNESGYYTVATGKMHFYPWEKRLGFQRRIIAEDKLWGYIEDDYHHFLRNRGYSKRDFVGRKEYHEQFMSLVSPVPWECTVDHFVGVESARWIEEYEGEEPFAMMVGFPGPHSPYDPAEEYAQLDPESMPEPLPEVAADTALMRGGRFRRGAGAGRKSWYTVENERRPERADFMRMRAYYAGLIGQIDVEVGRIVEALRKKGMLENTVILFSADHGDYLGDHGLQAKGSYYEGACRVPMLVRHPGVEGGRRSRELVCLTDVTATILELAGCRTPGYMDAQPLPGLGLPGERAKERIFGALRGGWMWCDGRWKLCKYAGGGAHLFDLEEDPEERQNRASDPECAQVYRRLDGELTGAIMRALDEAGFAERVYTFSHSSNPDFGRVGWDRDYPMRWEAVYPEEG